MITSSLSLFEADAESFSGEESSASMNDGERTITAIQGAEGKRLMYKDPLAEQGYTKICEQKKGDEQLEPF